MKFNLTKQGKNDQIKEGKYRMNGWEARNKKEWKIESMKEIKRLLN